MPHHAIPVSIQPRDLARIEALLRSGVQQVRLVLRALALRQLSHGAGAPEVARALPLSAKAIRQIAHRYTAGGLDRALYDRPRPGIKPILDEPGKARIVAMVRGKPPEGRARWTVRLVAEEAVRRNLVPRAGRETIRVLLQQGNLKPRQKRNPLRGELEEEPR